MRERVTTGKIVGATHAGLEDLPFQLPAELADGLGLESGLDAGYPASFAPSSDRSEEFGSPAIGSRKEAEFRLQTLARSPNRVD